MELTTTSLLEGSDGACMGQRIRAAKMYLLYPVQNQSRRDGVFVLHSFSDSIGEGNYRPSKVSEGPDGALYGVTVGGGAYDAGLDLQDELKTAVASAGLHHFPVGSKDGVNPDAALLLGSDGRLREHRTGPGLRLGYLVQMFLSAPPVTITGIQRLDWGVWRLRLQVAVA